MICLSLVFANELAEGIFGKGFLANPEKVTVCACWEVMITIPLLIHFML